MLQSVRVQVYKALNLEIIMFKIIKYNKSIKRQ